MFDVSWTDPTRETVGQRKSRKDQHANSLRQTPSIRSSRSTDSSQVVAKPSLLNLFTGGKKGDLTRTGSQPKLSALRPESSKSKASRRASSYTVSSDHSSHEVSIPTTTTTQIPVNSLFTGSPYQSDEQSSLSGVSESVFSGWTGRSRKTESTWSSVKSTASGSRFTQPLSPTSFMTRSTEVTVSPRDSVKDTEQVATVVHITAAGTIPIQVQDSPTRSCRPTPAVFDFPVPNFNLPEKKPSSLLEKDVELPSSAWSVSAGRQSNIWKPPEKWECPLEEAILPQQTSSATRISTPKLKLDQSFRPAKERRQKPPPHEFTSLQRSIRRMEAASDKIILERLKEEWIEVADAAVYRELELEKQLWMISALRGFTKQSSKVLEGDMAPSKILSLFGNHASSSFLSALTTAPEVHHFSTSPLSPKSYPNIHPLLAVSGPTSQLPYASNTFTSIHAFSLPALLPASSIPSLLKECHRTLAPLPTSPSPTFPIPFSSSTTTLVPTKPTARAGTLHLTIIDPSPLPATLGPRLRAWLDNHLVLNLERRFRCINPGRLFPLWLADAGLRAEGSTIDKKCFLACVPPPSEQEGIDAAKLELRSIVGRMLWKEMWGAFVEGEKWWWEDEGVVEECERMGTCWEYAVIEGVKEG